MLYKCVIIINRKDDSMDELDLTNKNIEVANNANSPITSTDLPTILEEKPKRKLSKGERKKLRIIKKLLSGEINGTEAAKKLGITTRQVRNLKRQVLNEGTEGVVHKNKNYKPYNTYDNEISTFVCKLYRREYRGTNFSEFARICQDEYGIEASRSTIYNFLRRGRIRSPQRKTKKKKNNTLIVGENQSLDTSTKTSVKKKVTKKTNTKKQTAKKTEKN